MNRKIFWTFFVVLIITSMLLSACQPAAPDQPEPPPVEQPVEEEITLRWRTRPDNQAEIDVYSSISQEIDNQLEGVKLVYEPGGAETASYQDVLKTELGAGTAPDVFWIPGTDVADFVQRGLILDISPFAAGFDSAAFYPGPMFHLTFNPETGGNDKLWGLPRDVSTFALYLNLDLIREAGAPDPRQLAEEGNWDWDAFLDVAQKVTALGGGVYGYGANAWWGPYGVWINAAGGGFFNEDRTACALDTPEAIQGLTFQQSLCMLSIKWPYLTVKTVNHRLWRVKWPCSKMDVGLLRVCARTQNLIGMLSKCPRDLTDQATGSFGVLMWSMRTPPNLEKHGNSYML